MLTLACVHLLDEVWVRNISDYVSEEVVGDERVLLAIARWVTTIPAPLNFTELIESEQQLCWLGLKLFGLLVLFFDEDGGSNQECFISWVAEYALSSQPL